MFAFVFSLTKEIDSMSRDKRLVVYRSEEEWQAILSRFERSGQRPREFCLAEGLAPSSRPSSA